ncbi:MAG: hypothetical protein HYW47_05970 [Deltaproteobacteria bacterium]|nr:hypothetical protein [Deltaproteobacteria bacterium]
MKLLRSLSSWNGIITTLVLSREGIYPIPTLSWIRVIASAAKQSPRILKRILGDHHGSFHEPRDDRKAEKGQALTEFLLIFILLLFLILLHFQASMSFVSSSYMNYVSFMGARTNMVSGEDRARAVIENMLGPSEAGYLSPFARAEEARVTEGGVGIPYKSYLYIPILRFQGQKEMNLEATTPMRREPDSNACGNLEHDNGC